MPVLVVQPDARPVPDPGHLRRARRALHRRARRGGRRRPLGDRHRRRPHRPAADPARQGPRRRPLTRHTGRVLDTLSPGSAARRPAARAGGPRGRRRGRVRGRGASDRGPRAGGAGRSGPVLLVSGYGGGTGALEPLRGGTEEGRSGRGGGAGGRRRHRRHRQAGRGSAASAKDAMKTGSTQDPSTSSATPPAAWSLGRGCVTTAAPRVARRVMSVGLPAPRHDGRRPRGRARSRVSRCVPAARARQPAAPRPQRPRRDAVRPGVRLGVVDAATASSYPSTRRACPARVNLTVQSVCPRDRAGHGDLPSDPVVLALLRTALGTGPARPPTSVACTSG